MDPALITAGDWLNLTRMLNDLYVAVGLGLVAATAFLLAHAILPSLAATHDMPEGFAGLRWVFYPIFILALGLTCYALASALSIGTAFLDGFYPRFGY
jgi:hypothetical protein